MPWATVCRPVGAQETTWQSWENPAAPLPSASSVPFLCRAPEKSPPPPFSQGRPCALPRSAIKVNELFPVREHSRPRRKPSLPSRGSLVSIGLEPNPAIEQERRRIG